MTLEKLMEYGHMVVREQENVKRVQLADKYLSEAALGDANDDAMKTDGIRTIHYAVSKRHTFSIWTTWISEISVFRMMFSHELLFMIVTTLRKGALLTLH